MHLRSLFGVALGALVAVFGSLAPVNAQQALQFSACDAPPRTLVPGSAATIGVDLNGNICINGTVILGPGTAAIGTVNQGTGGASAWSQNISQVGGNALVSTVPTAAPPTSSIVGQVAQSRVMSANTTNATLVAAGSHNLYAPKLCNTNAAARFVKFYDKATAPTVGTDIPIITWLLGPGACLPPLEGPIPFIVGLSYALTTGVADSDTGAVSANDIIGTLLYL